MISIEKGAESSNMSSWSLRCLFVVTFVVAAFFAYAGFIARENSRINTRLHELESKLRRTKDGHLVLRPIERPGIERFVGGERRHYVALLEFYRGIPSKYLSELLEIGVTNIGGLGIDEWADGTMQHIPAKFLLILTEFHVESISLGEPVEVEAISNVTKISGLRTLLLSGDWLTDEHVANLASNDTLGDICLMSDGLTDTCLESLDRFPNLMKVDIYSYHPEFHLEKVGAYDAKLKERWLIPLDSADAQPIKPAK